ncbi:thioredoxin fold domain-containing protein [Pontibacter sp. JAM-7]|uniref:thioredoxin fold domain-containing protein n=1 Tax=Pontibacter sp. JAM-7 TaxID=3366581 RepID=UPI003AF75FC8
MYYLGSLLCVLFLLSGHVQADIPLAHDLMPPKITDDSPAQQQRVILLLVSQPDCIYCIQLSNDLLQPMQRNTGYTNRTRFLRIEINTQQQFTDFDGNSITANAFAKRYAISMTPSLLLLDPTGQQLSEPLIGYTTPELYGFYLDQALQQSWQQLESSDR